jgi:hypothetical protein
LELLSEEERTAINKEAQALVKEQAAKVARKLYLDQCVREAKAKADPNEEMVDVQVDIPGFADRIVIDGVVYWQGTTSRVTASQKRAIDEIMCNAWKHERQTGGANASEYHKPRQYVLNGSGQLLRA